MSLVLTQNKADKLHFSPANTEISTIQVKDGGSGLQHNCTHFSYCSCHETLSPLWQDKGISRCFYDTVTSAMLAVLTVAVIFQIIKLKRNGVIVEAKYKPKSFCYKLQVTFLLLLLVEPLILFILNWTVIHGTSSGIDILVFILRSAAVFVSLWLLLLERKMMLLSKKGHSPIALFTWSVLLLIEVLSVVSWDSDHWWFVGQNGNDQIQLGLWVGRLVCTAFLFVVGFWAPGVPKLTHWLNMDDDRDIENGAEEEATSQTLGGHRSATESTWGGLLKKLKLLWPYMWPAGSFLLQFRVVLCIALLVAGRVVNPYVPIYYKNIVNALTKGDPWSVVWVQVIAYVGLKCLQGSGLSGGLLNGMRQYFWIRVQQYTNRHVQTKLFAHLHSLSLRWHLSRKTGEVLRSIDRGTTSINNLLSYFVFQILPTICDIVIAIIYFISSFNAWFGLIIFVCLALYLASTIIITEWRTKFRRDMNTKDNKAKQRAIDSLLNFETVKYYNAEDYEVGRFHEAIVDYQTSEYKTNSSLVVLNMSQMVIINIGLLAGSMLCAKYVLDGTFEIGDFVLFGTYIVQLYTPLGFFGTYYRMIQTSFIDMENMFDLFDEGREIVDEDEAIVLSIDAGTVKFDDVCFHYTPEKQILKNINFTVQPGQTYALVGPSGSGKSTIMRLLFRFYDVQSGLITLDGVDISTVTQQSLRACIGVVPQDTVLFNDNIMNNIRYGRVSASNEEVKEAAVSADIHHRIVTMPDQYETMVGERGLKLSGGEKQRVAIARTILKAPSIVLLDEATSALDTTTERNIQASLARVCAGRTSIVVAHRLSTIVNADCILVLKDGEILERGSHDELMDMEGIYCDMWQQQLTESPEQSKDAKTD
uniref:ATP-binding cassette sub-family B member 6 n=1 Tax=Phallusia mammillata TaxID=59560 RepID=A0A6F9D5Z6_9ASCI|nr:ATP-binding cassette sub-family B member 6, mitochondrial [Phallusia mammillata]